MNKKNENKDRQQTIQETETLLTMIKGQEDKLRTIQSQSSQHKRDEHNELKEKIKKNKQQLTERRDQLKKELEILNQIQKKRKNSQKQNQRAQNQ